MPTWWSPQWERCKNCGEPLDPPEVVDHHVVEEISNPEPRKVIDFVEFGGHLQTLRC
ncbi:MAG: hypothetical protein QXR87_05980 [Candidatus Hadarchaeales archaeon]